jgi:acetyl esterase/lipase
MSARRVVSVGALVLALPASVLAQDWVQPPRSQANVDALARVQVRTHTLPEAPGVEIPYGVYNVDADRTYLIGQSMGGGGTWHIGMKYPDIWAALAPMAPAIYSSPDVLASLRDRLPPIMVIHGDADTTVDVEISRRWTAKLRELGMEHVYIEVPGGSHASAGRENISRVFEFLSQHQR